MNTLDPRELREKVQLEVKKRQRMTKGVFFTISAAMFVVFGILGWGWVLTTLNQIPNLTEDMQGNIIGAMVMLTIGWGMSIMYQGISMMMETKAGERSMRDQVAAQVIAREQMNQLLDDPEPIEKPKRDEMYELTDDGEIQPADLTDDEIQRRSVQS